MVSCMIASCVRTLFLITIFSSVVIGQDRRISGDLNPGCDTCTDNDTLVYIKAEGAHDTIHQIWDFTWNTPSLILAVADKNSSMTVAWDNRKPVNFAISKNVSYSFAVTIDQLYEYDDLEDNGYIDNKCPRRVVPLTRVTWARKDIILTQQEVMLQMHGLLSDNWRTGIVDMKLDMLPFKDYAAQLPHLIHTANSSLLDVALVNVSTSRDYNASRLALRLLMASDDWANASLAYTLRKSLDDEHTPGVFEIVEIKSPGSASRGEGGFVQFRPVAYSESERGVASSMPVRISQFNRTRIPKSSAINVWYKGTDPRHLLVQELLVSFGETGDGFYKHDNYTSWSLTVGYGSPPLEGFSALVLGVLASGLGVPAVLAAGGALYALVGRQYRRRYRRHRAPPLLGDQ